MIPKLKDYEKIVGKKQIETIRQISYKAAVSDVHLTHVNSTSSGGGVAEILNIHVLLMNELGIETGWRLLKGSHSFFDVTKKFHNALQGEDIKITKEMKEIYWEETERNNLMNHFKNHDLVYCHDPQPLAMIEKQLRLRQPWIWRVHVDLSNPNPILWKFLKNYIKKYERVIVSMEKYKKKDLPVKQTVIAPAIDPLSRKNYHMNISRCHQILKQNGIETDKPLICQVSRFDKWKDPLGVLEIFRRVKGKIKDCHLVMIGDVSVDDPESNMIYNEVVNQVKDKEDIHLILKKDDILVNALQTCSDVILQNSIKEGFALTISEALWKKTPVVAKRVGGIPLQVIDGKTGYLVDNVDQAAKRCIKLIQDKRLSQKIGLNGKEHVKNNFLITRHLEDYLKLSNEIIFGKSIP